MQIKSLINKINNGRINLIIPAVIILLGILIRLKLLIINVPYGQDACALSANLYRSFPDFFKPLIYFQVAPPVFMTISSAIAKCLGNNYIFEVKDILLRIIPFLCGIISIPLFYAFLNKISENRYFKYICLFLFSFNYIAIIYSAQFKPYTLELMIWLILLNIFYSFSLKEISNKKLILFSLLFAFLPWCSNTCFLIIFIGYINILIDCIKNKYFDLKKTLIIIFPVLICFVIFFVCYYIPITQSEVFGYMKKFWNEAVPSFFTSGNFINMFGEKTENILQFHMNGYLYLIFFAINTVILLFRKNFKDILFILLPILFCIVASFLKISPYEGRIIIFVIPMFIILSCQFMLLIKNQKIAYVISFMILLFCLFAGYIKPIDKYYKLPDLFNHRNILKVLKEKNPGYKNVISNDILSGHYIGDVVLFSDNLMQSHFKDSNTYEFLEQAEPGEYWIAFVENYTPYKAELLDYVSENDSKFEILDIYTDKNNGNFIVNIKVKQR